ncbi:hypothetical protein [Acinetobacter sp.]|uniref:hypothetical protein n=1 Tax=Acinetobacter sp. TaxID=472 RepID=UPI00388E69B1
MDAILEGRCAIALTKTAFIAHISNADLGYTYNHIERKEDFSVITDSCEFNVHHMGGGIEYFVEQFYLNGELGFGQIEDKFKVTTLWLNSTQTEDSDVTIYHALAGYMPFLTCCSL